MVKPIMTMRDMMAVLNPLEWARDRFDFRQQVNPRDSTIRATIATNRNELNM